MATSSFTYRDAGVDIDLGNLLVERIRPIAARTRRPGVVGNVGGFGALFSLSQADYRNPILVSTTDGVGTKIKLAIEMDRHDTIGIDLVAMSVNDVVVQGAQPLIFLDYYGTAHLDIETSVEIIKGIARGCELAGAALVGGETAEMPGIYSEKDYDLAGFCVGAVEEEQLIDGSGVEIGDQLIGIASSGPHSNGFSLIRKVISDNGHSLGQPFDGRTLGETLLEPTRIYVKPVLEILERFSINAIAHVTGGGLVDNLPRVIPVDTQAVIDPYSWPRQSIFDWLQTETGLPDLDMYRTFNCGIGMVLVVSGTDVADIVDSLNKRGETAFRIGRIEAKTGVDRVIFEH